MKENHHEAFFVMVKRRLETAASLIKEQKFLVARYTGIVENTEALMKAEEDMLESKPLGYGDTAESEETPEIVADDTDKTHLLSSEDIEMEEFNRRRTKKEQFTIPLSPPYLTIYR